MPLACCLFVALALVAAAPGAQAQVPACTSVEVSLSGNDAVSVERPAQYVVEVHHTGQGTGTPLDPTAQARLAVSGAPSGWTVSLADTLVELAPGESKSTTLTVAVTPDAADAADLLVTATMDAGFGPLSEPLGCVATAESSLAMDRDEPVTREVIEAVGPWIYAIAAALLLALLVAAKLAMDLKRVAVTLSSPNEALTIRPGGKATVPLQVHNVASKRDVVGFHLSVVPEGWGALLPVQQVELGPGEAEELFLLVRAPDDAAPGDLEALSVLATSRIAPRQPATLRLALQVEAPAGDPTEKA